MPTTTTRLFAASWAITAILSTTACQWDCPTYVTTRPAPADTDGGEAGAGNGTTGPTSTGGGGASSSDAGTCTAGTFTKPDLSTLTPCGDGKGHCYDKAKSPMADQLTACADASQVCVPDEVLNANGNPLKSCTSIVGPGGCITAHLLPQLEAQGGSFLKQDVCDAGQLCAPCVNPQDNTKTPFCVPIGVRTEACGAGGAAGGTADASTPPATPPPACCTSKGHSNGVCLAESVVPANQRDQTKQDACPNGDKCLPASFVNNKPVKCTQLVGDGVCMDKCFNDMMKLAGDIGFLSSDGCGDTEVCVPCFAVSGQGVPGCQ